MTACAVTFPKLSACAALLALVAACGGGSDRPVPAAAASQRVSALAAANSESCEDPHPGVQSTVVFEAPVGVAADGVQLSPNGSSACFTGTTEVGVRGTVSVAQGPGSFYYFEVTRSDIFNLGVGVSGSAADLPAEGTEFQPSTDALLVNYTNSSTRAGDGGIGYSPVGDEHVLGFAVDYRARWPVVYVIGNGTTAGTGCATAGQQGPCVFARTQLASAPAALHIYAYGSALYSATPRKVSINTGSDLLNKPYAYAQAAVRKALRAAWFHGDRAFNPQWPSATGPIALPALTRAGPERAAVRLGDRQPYVKTLDAAAGDLTASIQWIDANGTVRGTGGSLPLSGQTCRRCPPGEYPLIAAVTDPATGRYSEVPYLVTVIAADANPDTDEDGLGYDEEKAARTDPTNPDTDGDGLSDGAEQALGYIPRRPDTDRNGVVDGVQLAGDPTLALHAQMVMETGATPTSSGIVLSDDGLSAAFTSELNQDCVQQNEPYTDPLYADLEFCKKRAVRANAGIKPGEFRYYETRRLGGVANIGHGFTTAAAQIDPFCCFTSLVTPEPPLPQTPPSMAINSLGGMFVNLVLQVGAYPDHSPENSVFYGFAVDYRGPDPVVYAVTTDSAGGMALSLPLTVPGFNGGDVMPFLYGHEVFNTQAASAMNLGLRRFHYDTAALRTRLASLGVDVTAFVPGVGIHRRP